jgi:hypothetical protein
MVDDRYHHGHLVPSSTFSSGAKFMCADLTKGVAGLVKYAYAGRNMRISAKLVLG